MKKFIFIIITVLFAYMINAEIKVIDAKFGNEDGMFPVANNKIDIIELSPNCFSITPKSTWASYNISSDKDMYFEMRYVDNGVEKNIRVREMDTAYILLDTRTTKNFSLCVAYYGEDTHWLDVTSIIKENLKKKDKLIVNNEVFGNNKAPSYKSKKLILFYSINQGIYNIVIPENNELDLVALRKGNVPVSLSVKKTENDSSVDDEKKNIKNSKEHFTDLTDFENQLDYIERNFWIAASLKKTDPFAKNFDRKIYDLVILARNIQKILVDNEISNEKNNFPKWTVNLMSTWQRFVGKGPYYHSKLYCSSRRCYGKYLKNNKETYLQWLETRVSENVRSFNNSDNKSISGKVSDYYISIKELRYLIVEMSDKGFFYENPQLAIPDKNFTIDSIRSRGNRK